MATFNSLPVEILLEINNILETASDKAALAATCRGFNAALTSQLWTDHAKMALGWGVEKNQIPTVERAIRHGANVNARFAAFGDYCISEWHAINVAVNRGHLSMVAFLISQGADVMAYSSRLCSCSTHIDGDRYPHQFMPLHTAICSGHIDIAKLLLAKGADPNIIRTIIADPTRNTTALHMATKHGHTDLINFLVTSCGSNIDAKDEYGETPLYTICDWGSNRPDLSLSPLKAREVYDQLMALGANVHEPNDAGVDPVSAAINSGNFDLAAEMLDYGDIPDGQSRAIPVGGNHLRFYLWYREHAALERKSINRELGYIYIAALSTLRQLRVKMEGSTWNSSTCSWMPLGIGPTFVLSTQINSKDGYYYDHPPTALWIAYYNIGKFSTLVMKRFVKAGAQFEDDMVEGLSCLSTCGKMGNEHLLGALRSQRPALLVPSNAVRRR
jgi:ankyrin repeat protein